MADEQLIQLLRQLVAIPSVNPALADDPAIGSEAPLAQFLADHLAEKGFSIERHEIVPGRPNVVARRGPAAPKRTLLVEAHLDTQGIHGMTVPPFSGELRDGRIYGRGACDMKGPMAAALHALTPEVLDALAAAGVQLIFVGAVGEEKGNVGARQLVELGLGADEALILEPTELAIVHAHKGTLWYEVELKGQAAHGSNPQHGLSAVRAMVEVIGDIEREAERAREQRDHPLLGPPTVNIGVIRGGSSINIVPDRCVIEVDRRTVPGEDHRDILDRIRVGLMRLQSLKKIAGYEVKKLHDGTPFATPADTRLVQRLVGACRSHGVPAKTEGAGWFSDAGPFSQTCREVAVFGPGSIRQAHTADEYIEVASLQKGSELLHQFFRDLADEVKGTA